MGIYRPEVLVLGSYRKNKIETTVQFIYRQNTYLTGNRKQTTIDQNPDTERLM
jgi:hypothetical protein